MLLRVPATSANLGPGFDCIGMALNLYNYIDFEMMDQFNVVEIDIQGEGKKQLSQDNSNLVYQAYSRVFSYLNKPVPGIKLVLKNNIPLARGLGSSSAAIVGGLLVANHVLNNKLSLDQLLDLAVDFEGHPDNVAPALLGGIVLCSLNQQKVLYQKISPPQGLYCSILIPNYELSTKKAREILPQNVPLGDAIFNIGRLGFLISALHTENLELFKFALEDKLHQPFRNKLIPGISEIISESKKLKTLGVAISGAGPSLIIFHRKNEHESLSVLLEIMAKYKIDAKILNLKPISEGANFL